MAARFNARPHSWSIPSKRARKRYRVTRDDSRSVFCADASGKKSEERCGFRIIEDALMRNACK